MSELAARNKFSSTNQKENETIDGCITRIRNIVKHCEFDEKKNKCVRDRIVFGVHSDKLKETLFSEENLTLAKAICEAHDAIQKYMESMKEKSSA